MAGTLCSCKSCKSLALWRMFDTRPGVYETFYGRPNSNIFITADVKFVDLYSLDGSTSTETVSATCKHSSLKHF